MAKMFQIYEDDLAILEREVPCLADALLPQMDNALRVKIRALQRVIMNVRWDYGPPEQVERVELDGLTEDPDDEGPTQPDRADGP